MKAYAPSFSKASRLDGPESSTNPLAAGLAKARAAASRFKRYQGDLVGYCREILGVEPWPGRNGHKGQLELFEDISASVRAQLAGQPAPQVFRVEAGHGVGKTYGAAGIVNWFFDVFVPSIAMTTAPTADQVELLLWKNIKAQRQGKDLPGRVLPDAPKMVKGPNHFAYGRTTSDAGGQGTARIQGQHDEYLLFILDEAEGLQPYVLAAVDAMMTGGRVIVCLMIANPMTRTSAFAKKGREPGVANYRLSALDFPNVVDGVDTVKGGTGRGWVNAKIAKHCIVVPRHDEDEHTFSVGWDVPLGGDRLAPAGTVFQPDAEFMFRVMGIAPKNLSANTLITPGRYEAACKREPAAHLADPTRVRYGVDVARDGDDVGTIYRLWRGTLVRVARMAKLHTGDYLGALKDDFRRAVAGGATDCEVRVDGGGGWGSGLIDGLCDDLDVANMFERMAIHEVHNNGTPYDAGAYADAVTEMYAEAGDALADVRILNAPEELEADLTERLYRWARKRGVAVKQLEPKEGFKKRIKRSPDDGDGAVLALAPDHLFEPREAGAVEEFYEPVSISPY